MGDIQGGELGLIIQCSGGTRSEVEQQLMSIEHKLGLLQKVVLANPDAARDLQDAGIKYAELLERLSVLDYKTFMQRIHSDADKSVALLARLIHPEMLPILSITVPTRRLIGTQSGINEIFLDFYINLYTGSGTHIHANISAYLHQLELPSVTGEDRKALGASIKGEIREAIKQLAQNKTPGSQSSFTLCMQPI
ncbi:hypothetical protein NDU88_007248 [Pleurodeles waltl]|uniref:Uncharacterized protein n=1 Tax=Pleurodeles waltl TaxID=8319 RepID=A0AAV7NVF0_PLEWA|nr:hypothetical protein NDU88_007248 [Pleurodeles waltl]